MAENPIRGASSTITNNYGVLVKNQTSGTNNYGVYVEGASTYALWVDSGVSQFDGQVQIGTSDTTGTLLVLDTKTDGGDPTGVNGAMYYNSSIGKMRCYQNGNWGNCSNSFNSRKIYMIPEFAGGTLTADGTNNSGVMSSDYDSTDRHNYYSWSSSQASLQDYDIVVRNQIPNDYRSGFGTFKVWVYGASTSTANNDVQVTVRDNAGTACATSVSVLPGTANTWTEQSVTLTGCSFAANDIITVSFKALSLSNNGVRVGEVSYLYTN
jgi:hypothetical protein